MRIEEIRLDEVKKAYGDIETSEGISLSLHQGELLYVAGSSGGGKSVLTDIINSRMPKSGGRIYVNGRPAVLTSIRQTQITGIFCVRYKTSVTSNTFVEENLCLVQKQDCLSFPVRQRILHVRETPKLLGIGYRLQAPVANLSPMKRHTIEICRACYADMGVLILDGITRDYTLKETECVKRPAIRLRERRISVLWIGTRPEIMLDAADRLAVLRKGCLAAVLYRKGFERQMIDRIIIDENREVGREIIRSQAEPGGQTVLPSVREVRARGLRDVSFYMCPGGVAGSIHPGDTYCQEIVHPLNGEFKVESRSAWLAGRQVGLTGGRKNMVRRDFEYTKDYKKSLLPEPDVAEDPIIAGLGYSAPRVGMRKKPERTAACDYLTLLDIREEDLKRLTETLNHRCRLNVALYKWITARARLIVIDDLLSGTDILMRNSVREFLGFARNRGIDTVYYSPNEGELTSVCDRLYELAEGKVSCRQCMREVFSVFRTFFSFLSYFPFGTRYSAGSCSGTSAGTPGSFFGLSSILDHSYQPPSYT